MKINGITSFTGMLKISEASGLNTKNWEKTTTPEQDKLLTDEFNKICSVGEYDLFTREKTKDLSKALADILGDEKYLPLKQPSYEARKEIFYNNIKKESKISLEQENDEKINKVLDYLIKKHLLYIPQSAICDNNAKCIIITNGHYQKKYSDNSVQTGYKGNSRFSINLEV